MREQNWIAQEQFPFTTVCGLEYDSGNYEAATARAKELFDYDGLRADRLPAALVQGQRDYFGSHTYLRVDREGSFHTLWSGDRTEVDGEGVPVVMPQPTEGDPTQD